jgi:putative FmdB family regulatory protein
MLTYEYQCKNCNHHFEAEQRISDQPLKECPECKGEVQRLISNGNFILQGDGWYRDGYESKNK